MCVGGGGGGGGAACLSACACGGQGILCLFTSIFPRRPGLQDTLRLAHSTASGVISVPTKSQPQAEAPSSG